MFIMLSVLEVTQRVPPTCTTKTDFTHLRVFKDFAFCAASRATTLRVEFKTTFSALVQFLFLVAVFQQFGFVCLFFLFLFSLRQKVPQPLLFLFHLYLNMVGATSTFLPMKSAPARDRVTIGVELRHGLTVHVAMAIQTIDGAWAVTDNATGVPNMRVV